MFNSNPTPSGIKMISKAHRKTGTTSFLPTVITDTPEVVRSAAFAVLETHGKFGVRGIHIEGPHINPERKGTHNQDLIRKIDQDTLDLLEMLRSRELPVLLTLAPEMVPAGMIASMVKMGVVVSAGHTNATANQIEQALAEGVSMFTHLFNGMSQMTGREPGTVGAALASDAWCGIIADGHHVDMRMVNLAFATGDKGAKIFIVSDAMATWQGPNHFNLYGEDIVESGGKLVNRAGSLAGAHIDMCGSISNLLRSGISLETAMCAGISNPAQAMGIDRDPPFLPSGTDAALVLFDPADPIGSVEVIE